MVVDGTAAVPRHLVTLDSIEKRYEELKQSYGIKTALQKPPSLVPTTDIPTVQRRQQTIGCLLDPDLRRYYQSFFQKHSVPVEYLSRDPLLDEIFRTIIEIPDTVEYHKGRMIKERLSQRDPFSFDLSVSSRGTEVTVQLGEVEDVFSPKGISIRSLIDDEKSRIELEQGGKTTLEERALKRISGYKDDAEERVLERLAAVTNGADILQVYAGRMLAARMSIFEQGCKDALYHAERILEMFAYEADTITRLRNRGLPVSKVEFEGNALTVEGVHHPHHDPNDFKQFDVRFEPKQTRGHIITGSNGSGKTTFLDAVGNIIERSQTTGFVTAISATLSYIPHCIAKISAAEDGSIGMGNFETRVRKVFGELRAAQKGSILILDEYFDGTTNREGLRKLYEAIVEECEKRQHFILFSTHMHDLLNGLPGITDIGITPNHQVLYGTPVFDSSAEDIIKKVKDTN